MDDLTKKNNLQALWATSQLGGANASYLDGLFEDFLTDPSRVPAEWREFFQDLPRVHATAGEVSHAAVREQFRHLRRPAAGPSPTPGAGGDGGERQIWVLQLINAYRFRGHQQANFNPLGSEEPPVIEELSLEYYGLGEADLDCEFNTGSLVGPKRATLRDILSLLRDTYSGRIGAEYMYIADTEEKRWIQRRLESMRAQPSFSEEQKQRLLARVTAAESLERYLHSKYVGQKRFSLEGGEGLIPMLDELIQRGGAYGLKELVIGMAHRGRLNVLVNIMGKQPADLFREFEGKVGNGGGSGDVKYHQGFSSNINSPGGEVHVTLAFNPSHLEIVGPVVEGSVRARQARRDDADGSQVLSVLIHGDAAFAGQGVVMETFSMSQSRGYSTKGTLHIVINNQIGFTSSDRQDARSTLYCTDVAKMIDAPIFHVDGDDPEAIALVTHIALDYRMRYRKDVVIDMVCYRRHGHSEADEPMATQPLMYKRIAEKATPREIYTARLIEQNILDEQQAEAMIDYYRAALDAGECVVPDLIPNEEANYPYAVDWSEFAESACLSDLDTTIPLVRLRDLVAGLHKLPESFELHHSVAKIIGNRAKMAAGSIPIDWGFAETLAYASLVTEGYNVRLSGQDAGRGTFFHRHAVLYNQASGQSYIPLRNLADSQGDFLVINSLLSEEAVLAFEYGYATTDPHTLTIWEAQFGDFANNAQVVIDQFISAGEQKWNRMCGLVMLLPHGYEGQGPEHTSARLERYLQLCAEYNMQVCVPTTPAQIFHLLRRQMHQTCRKPLIVMSPKSLLRNRLAVSCLEDLTQDTYKMVIPEIDELHDGAVRRVVMCSGKVYYDLLEKRRKLERQDVALIRVEQLYPFPESQLRKHLARYSKAEEFVWCQEEPKNQGAWYASQHHIRAVLGETASLEYAGRPMSAAPAAGSAGVHTQQQHRLINEALGVEPEHD